MIPAIPSEKRLAKLLALTPEEYKQLKHSPLIESRNDLGVIIGYFMHISPNNDPCLLDKMDISRSNFKRFRVNDIKWQKR